MSFDPNYAFRKKPEEYKSTINPLKGYVEQAVNYLHKMTGKPKKDILPLVIKQVKSTMVDPSTEFYYRQENGDDIRDACSLTEYIRSAQQNNEIIVPSLTTYVPPEVKESIHSKFLDKNIKLRSIDKHEMLKAKVVGDTEKENAKNTLQKKRKVDNNAMSGTYASKSTAFFNPSAHYTLTSMTRTITSVGNAVSESIVGSNKHFKNSDIVFNYITAIITIINMNDVRKVIDQYNLVIPTTQDVMDMVLKSTKYYWEDPVAESNIFDYINKLTDEERTAVCYVNDWYMLRKLNDDMLRDMIGGLARKCRIVGIENPLDIIKTFPEAIINLIHHILIEELKGNKEKYDKLDISIQETIASTGLNILNIIEKYYDLFQVFLVTEIAPITIAYIKDMLREIIVLSDTDSTCGSYDEWVIWYFGELKFTPEATAIAAAIMTINTQVIDHYIKLIASNMNIAPERASLLKMKNEFYWDVFTSTNVSKHYFANARIQEGNVFKDPDRELKGVHLIASNTTKYIRNKAYELIDRYHKQVTNNEKIELYEYVKEVADAERWLIKEIERGTPEIFRLEKMKEAAAYKLGAEKSPYIHHLLWETVFSKKYGISGDPLYLVVSIPTVMQSKGSMQEFLDNMEDREIAESLTEFMKQYNKTNIGTFKVPFLIAGEKGVPAEILKGVDIFRLVTVNCNVLYLFLESIGFYRKTKYLVSDMGY